MISKYPVFTVTAFVVANAPYLVAGTIGAPPLFNVRVPSSKCCGSSIAEHQHHLLAQRRRVGAVPNAGDMVRNC